MKKVLVFLLFVFPFVVLVGCENLEDEKPEFEVENLEVQMRLEEGSEVVFTINITKGDPDLEFDFEISNNDVIKIEDRTLKALAVGTVSLKIYLKDFEEIAKTFEITVDPVEEEHKLTLSGEASVEVGKTITLIAVDNKTIDNEVIWSSSDETILIVDQSGVVTGVKEGAASVIIKSKFDETITLTKEITVLDFSPQLTLTGEDSVEVGKTITLVATDRLSEDNKVIWSSSNENVLIVDQKGVVTGVKEGTANVIIKSKLDEEVTLIKEITILDFSPQLTLTGEDSVEEGQSITLVATDRRTEDNKVIWSSSDESILIVDQSGVVTGIKPGIADVIIKSKVSDETLTHKIEVTKYEDIEAPMFILGENYKERVILNWNKPFNPLEDITVIDNVDGDLTNKIKVISDFDNQEYGVHQFELLVEDEAGNKSSMQREVEVVWNYDVTFIGHGGSYYGLLNSEEAFLYAVQVLKYQALEADLKQTSDGVFVMCHDDTFAGYNIASTTWSVLKDVEHTASRNSGIPAQNGSVKNSPYTAKLCSLERYLEICQEYNATAVIELKYSNGINNNDQSRMRALMDVITNAGMREDTVLLTSQYNCLIWTRNNGYSDIKCQYLVNSFESQTILNRCIAYNLDISTNVTGTHSNNDEWLAKYFDAGLKVSVFTFTQYVDYPVVQTWIDKGVDYVTCDWQLMSKLNLPENTKVPSPTYQVIFKDYDGTIIKEVSVREGRIAASPANPTRHGYTFTGWDRDLRDVREDFEVFAEYSINTYTITYDSNTSILTETSWPSKEAFIQEFYTDLYDWLLANGMLTQEITVNGNKVTMVKNGVTVSFSNVEELKAIDKYEFEKTISNIIYKPVVRAADGSAVIQESAFYFLNSKLYREKYQALDAWFVNCINKQYTAYDKTYTPLADGRIQIMFRFQQWQQGTSIAPFNTLPAKYEIVSLEDYQFELPATALTYTILDEFDLPPATGNHEFLGWFLDKECTQSISKIITGSVGSIIVYAKWGDKISS